MQHQPPQPAATPHQLSQPGATPTEMQQAPIPSSGGNGAILSQIVYGEVIVLMSITCEECVQCVTSVSFSADHPRHLMLFRKNVSRRAAGKGRAVLEGVGLDSAAIRACFEDHPLEAEEAVQSGLTKWIEGKGLQPPIWQVLFDAMTYAGIAQQHIRDLKTDLGLN